MKRNPAKTHLPPMPEYDLGVGYDVYDPREESIRAVARGTGGRWGLAQGAYGKKRDAAEVIQRSYERYQRPDELVRKRQEYEIMLGSQRRSGMYRVTAEPTRRGIKFFVWPLPSGTRKVTAYSSMREAQHKANQLNEASRRPAMTLSSKPYTARELSEWLPPHGVFSGRSGKTTKVEQKRIRKQARKNPGTPPQQVISPTKMKEVVKLVQEGSPVGMLILTDLGSKAYFKGEKLDNVDLARFDASAKDGHHFNMMQTMMSDCSFRGADLSGAKAMYCNFWGVNFAGCNLSNATFESCIFDSNCNFSGANITGTTFTDCGFFVLNSAGGMEQITTMKQAVADGSVIGLGS